MTQPFQIANDENVGAVNKVKPSQRGRAALTDVTSNINNRRFDDQTTKKNSNYTTLASRYIDKYQTEQELRTSIASKDSQPLPKNNYIRDEEVADIDVDEPELHQDVESDDFEEDTEKEVIPLLPIYDDASNYELKNAYTLYDSTALDLSDDDTYDIMMVSEDSKHIFKYMRKLELQFSPNPNYMELQPHLKWSFRATLLDWLVKVHLRFQLLPETLYLTVNLIDRFLSLKVVTLNKFQLVGATALFIAAKYEEINCPTLNDIIYVLDGLYEKQEILDAERFMINSLEYEIGWPGPMSFLRRISKADDYEYNIRTLAKYLLEITIMDLSLAGAPASWLATGAYYLSKIILGDNSWSPKHVYYSEFTKDQLIPLVSVIIDNCKDPMTTHEAICEKYSSRRYQRSATLVFKWISAAQEKINV